MSRWTESVHLTENKLDNFSKKVISLSETAQSSEWIRFPKVTGLFSS